MRFKIIIILLTLLFGLNLALAQEINVTNLTERAEAEQINITPPPEKCESNLGEVCSNQDDCISCSPPYQAYCVWCPEDTSMKIYTAPDPYYARLINDTSFVVKSGGEQGYCAYPGKMSCVGTWNGNEYRAGIEWLREPNPEEHMPISRFLTKDILDVWKQAVTKNISEGYFNEHFLLTFVDAEILNPYNTGNDLLMARIHYNFSFDWTEAIRGDNWDLLAVAENRNGTWTRLTDEEIYSYYDKELERWHNLGKIKITEQEVSSIILEEEAISKLKSCNSEIDVKEVSIGSENYSITFVASGRAYTNTSNCEISHENKYTIILGSVNLITGESTCMSHEAPCALYIAEMSKEGISKQLISRQNLIIYAGVGILILIIILIVVFIKIRKK